VPAAAASAAVVKTQCNFLDNSSHSANICPSLVVIFFSLI